MPDPHFMWVIYGRHLKLIGSTIVDDLAEIFLVLQQDVDSLHLPRSPLRIVDALLIEVVCNLRSSLLPTGKLGKDAPDDIEFGLWSGNEDDAISLEMLLLSRAQVNASIAVLVHG